ncbi:D-amino-acid dehydrogenase [Sphingobium sp. AP50]|uniref:NAD(P)/FAD-dependent oxidoreductase n=1 Tax=Sphingobium sp. AP50 TaxID=1884369 RepID=UPI0008BDD828|nr:FAD-binding oxidoreductase [Sphingobium sp. AP50]SEJ24164.1 D-amino-acid dehydrogenase [Sphingobium sp. AP50]
MGRIAIIGGGVVGLSTGIALLDAGQAVVLVDDDADGQAASWGNAGHIAVEQVAPLASLSLLRSVPGRLFAWGGALDFPLSAIGAWLPFGLRLMAAARPAQFRHGSDVLRGLLEQAMPAWTDLATRIGAPDMVRQEGHYVVWHGADAAAAGRKGWEAADTGIARVHDVSQAELAGLSQLGAQPIAGAIRFSGSGQIADLVLLRQALRTAFLAQGGEIVGRRATMRRSGRRIEVPGVEADRILVCAGVHSRALMEAVEHKVPMIAERGYHIRADAADWPAEMPPIVYEERSMIVTRYRNSVQAASFVELGRIDAQADPRKWERLEGHVAELGLPMRGPFTRWMGCRPTLPDYLPAIGRSQKADNLFYAFGHQHLGLTLAPITARLMTGLVTGAEPAVSVAPFDLTRYAGNG